MKRRRQIQPLKLPQLSGMLGGGLLLVGISLVLILLIMEKTHPDFMASMRGGSADVVAPIAQLLSAPSDFVAASQAKISHYLNTYQENIQLKEDNTKLLKWQSLAHHYARENEQLKKLLHVVPESKQHYISANMVSAYSQSARQMSLLSAGSRDGVRKDLAVIAPEGLIGRVIEVGEQHSRVLLINDINANIPVISERLGVRAILTGHQDGRELKLDLAENSERFQVGDRLVTSGDGGMIPAGIPVASITAIRGNNVSAAPLVNVAQASLVTIIDYEL